MALAMTVTQEPGTESKIPTDRFGVRLGMIEAEMGMNMTEVATLCDLDPESWRKWKKGPRLPRKREEVCRKINKATGFDYTWLMVGGPLVTGRYLQYAQVRAALDLVHYVGPDQMTLDDAPRYDVPSARCLVPVG